MGTMDPSQEGGNVWGRERSWGHLSNVCKGTFFDKPEFNIRKKRACPSFAKWKCDMPLPLGKLNWKKKYVGEKKKKETG